MDADTGFYRRQEQVGHDEPMTVDPAQDGRRFKEDGRSVQPDSLKPVEDFLTYQYSCIMGYQVLHLVTIYLKLSCIIYYT